MTVVAIIFRADNLPELDHMLPICFALKKAGHKVSIFSRKHLEKDAPLVQIATENFLLRRVRTWNLVFLIDYCLRLLNPRLRVSQIRSIFRVLSHLPDRLSTMLFIQADIFALGWGASLRFPHSFATAKGAPTIALPHGFNVFTNETPGDYESTFGKATFSDRSSFDSYVVNTDDMKSALIGRGMIGNRIHRLGSVRFSKEWVNKMNARAEAQEIERRFGREVCLQLPNPDYGVRWENLRSVILLLEEMKLSAWIVPHARQSNSKNAKEFNRWLKKKWPEAMWTNGGPLESQIALGKLVLFSGTSAGIPALILGRACYHLDFVTRNSTIFSELKGASLATVEDLQSVLNKIVKETPGQSLKPEEVDEWLLRYVSPSNGPATEWHKHMRLASRGVV